MNALDAPTDARARPPRAVVVAMKPQLRGRIRRTVVTLLELGYDVTVVNTTPRDDFFVGLSHPRLKADFVDVRSAAVRYQSWMTRQNARRAARWAEQRERREARPRTVSKSAGPTADRHSTPRKAITRPWSSGEVVRLRRKIRRRWQGGYRRGVRTMRTLRKRRDLAVRAGLKRMHLLNRFVLFWAQSPARIAVHSPDLIVSSDLPGLVGASRAATRLRRPHLHDCHELYLDSTSIEPFERLLLRPWEKRYMRRADSVVVVNRSIRDEYQRRYGVEGVVLRNCVPAVSERIRTHPVDVRSILGLAQTDDIVLYQGGLMEGRGLAECIRAVPDFPSGAHLVFIGDGRLREGLADLADNLGVGSRVHWIPAVVPADLPAYTAAATVGLIPYQPVSRNNALCLPNKAFEYTGVGIPFVASDLPELRRIVRTRQCGEVYDPFDHRQLASAVCAVLDPENYAAYRTAADDYGRDTTWEIERNVLVSEIERLSFRLARRTPPIPRGTRPSEAVSTDSTQQPLGEHQCASLS